MNEDLRNEIVRRWRDTGVLWAWRTVTGTELVTTVVGGGAV